MVNSEKCGSAHWTVSVSSFNPALGQDEPLHLLILSLVPNKDLAGRVLPQQPLCSPAASMDSQQQPWTTPFLWLQVYVQDILRQMLAGEVLRVIHEEQGHIYICGDVRMARDVACTLKQLVAAKLRLSEDQVEDYFFQLKVWQPVWGEGCRSRHRLGVRLILLDPKGILELAGVPVRWAVRVDCTTLGLPIEPLF